VLQQGVPGNRQKIIGTVKTPAIPVPYDAFS
jgi:hypothetical protein